MEMGAELGTMHVRATMACVADVQDGRVVFRNEMGKIEQSSPR